MTSIIAILFFLGYCPRPVYGFHIDSSPTLARNTYLKRDQPEKFIRNDQKASAPALKDTERTWRFPDSSKVRPLGDATLPCLTDEELLWRHPSPGQVRHSSTVGSFEGEERMWRDPHHEFTRHQTHFPLPLKDEERFWWKNENFGHLLLEEDEIEERHNYPQVTTNFVRRPSSKLSRHPHSIVEDELSDAGVATMQEDDRLGWLTENTHRLLLDENGLTSEV